MVEASKTILLFLFTFITWIFQLNLQTDSEAHYKLKETIELAAHDAALQVIPTELQKGMIVFDEIKALEYFKDSMIYHLRLRDGGMVLHPEDHSFYQDPIHIVHMQFIDHSNTTSYPFLFQDPTYGVTEIVRGPAVYFVVETKTPRILRGAKKDIRKAVIYEYPF